MASVEVRPGLVIKIAAWMLDSAACAGMEIGAPRASLAALSDLHYRLVAQCFRRSSFDERAVIEEKADEVLAGPAGAMAAKATAPAPPAGRMAPPGHRASACCSGDRSAT